MPKCLNGSIIVRIREFIAQHYNSQFKLLIDEQPHLLQQPKPYNGVHPKIVVDNILKNDLRVNNKPTPLITILGKSDEK